MRGVLLESAMDPDGLGAWAVRAGGQRGALHRLGNACLRPHFLAEERAWRCGRDDEQRAARVTTPKRIVAEHEVAELDVFFVCDVELIRRADALRARIAAIVLFRKAGGLDDR